MAATRRCWCTRAPSMNALERCPTRPPRTRRSSGSCSSCCSVRSAGIRSGSPGPLRGSREAPGGRRQTWLAATDAAREAALPPDAGDFLPAHGNKDVSTAGQMGRMKHQALVGNIGHFDNEIDMAGLAQLDRIERINIKPQVDEWVFADGHAIIVLSEGR